VVRTLFAKILLWSVSVQVLTVGTILALVTFYLPESQAAVDNAFTLYADTAVALYEHFGPEALDKFLAHSGENTLLQLRLSTTKPGMDCAPRPQLDAQGGHRPAFDGSSSTSILARGTNDSYCLSIHAKNGGLPESAESRRSRLQITILLELFSCAGLSYFIARYLSRPISELRQAATRLAKGDLSVRVGQKFARRHDEAADLVREFDQMAERVAALIEAQRRLIGDVSHEIKSPLARLNMALGLARRDADAYAPKQFERMQREIDSISQLIRELLTLASLEAAGDKPLTDSIDLHEVIVEVLADIAFESPNRVEDLVFIAPDREVFIVGNKALLSRAIENVLRNAVFYTAPGAAIEIGYEALDNGGVRLSILDQGPGVPEQALSRLFDPFYRVDDARTRQTGGTGIGLAICQRAIELHQGTITAANRFPHGLAVVIELPQSQGNSD